MPQGVPVSSSPAITPSTLSNLSLPSFLPGPYSKRDLPVLDRDAERDLRCPLVAQLRYLILHERRELVERHDVLAVLPPRIHQ